MKRGFGSRGAVLVLACAVLFLSGCEDFFWAKTSAVNKAGVYYERPDFKDGSSPLLAGYTDADESFLLLEYRITGKKGIATRWLRIPLNTTSEPETIAKTDAKPKKAKREAMSLTEPGCDLATLKKLRLTVLPLPSVPDADGPKVLNADLNKGKRPEPGLYVRKKAHAHPTEEYAWIGADPERDALALTLPEVRRRTGTGTAAQTLMPAAVAVDVVLLPPKALAGCLFMLLWAMAYH